MPRLKQFVLWLEKAMPEYRWLTDRDSAHQDRTSCRCLERRGYVPQSPNKIQGVEADEYAVSSSGEEDGHRHRSLAGCEASGSPFRLNLNNNYNVGVSAGMPAGNSEFSLLGYKLNRGRT